MFIELIKKAFEAPNFKAGAVIIINAFLNFISPSADAMVGIFLLLLFDMITGILASRKRGETFEPGKSRKSLIKLICYLSAILGTLLYQKIYLSDLTYRLDFAIASLVAVTELGSSYRNIKEITGIDIFGAIKDHLQSKNKE